jgi:ABC-2 type transport system ATP-binding protein
MSEAIEVHNLRKVYPRRIGLKEYLRTGSQTVTAINELSLTIEKGEVFGLLGPNGAGKTTFIKILSTLILPTRGTVKVYGHDLLKESQAVKEKIGLIHSDERSFFWRLTGRQNLEFFASLYQLPAGVLQKRIDELLHLVGLEQKADTMFHYYSTGMKQKLAIARGLLTHPKVLFMDEALRSVDPVTTQNIRSFIREDYLRIFEGTVILATNRLDEAAQLCDRIAVLNKGRLIACGRIEELKTHFYNSIDYDLAVRNLDKAGLGKIHRMPWIQKLKTSEEPDGTTLIEVRLPFDEEENIHDLFQAIVESGGRIRKCTRTQPSLEDVFNNILDIDNEQNSVKKDPA